MGITEAIDAMMPNQLLEVQRHVASRLAHLAKTTPMGFMLTPGRTSGFKRGDLVEFHSTRFGKQIKVIVDRVNDKTLSCREFDNPERKWRVAPSFCRLVGADKVESGAVAPVVPAARPVGAVPSAAHAGSW